MTNYFSENLPKYETMLTTFDALTRLEMIELVVVRAKRILPFLSHLGGGACILDVIRIEDRIQAIEKQLLDHAFRLNLGSYSNRL